MGAYSRNAAVGLSLCSQKLVKSDRKEQWRGDQWVLLNQWLWNTNALNAYLPRKHLLIALLQPIKRPTTAS